MHCYGGDNDASGLDRRVEPAAPRHPHGGDRYVSAERLGGRLCRRSGELPDPDRKLERQYLDSGAQNGDTWHRVRSLGTLHCHLYSVAITSQRNAWAVGQAANNKIVILHWNGRRWRLAVSSNPKGGGRVALYGVTARSARSTWAVGGIGLATNPRTLIERWEQ